MMWSYQECANKTAIQQNNKTQMCYNMHEEKEIWVSKRGGKNPSQIAKNLTVPNMKFNNFLIEKTKTNTKLGMIVHVVWDRTNEL